MLPVTPRKTRKERERLLLSWNNKFGLDLPIGPVSTDGTPAISQSCVQRIYFLCSHNDDAALTRVENDLEQRAEHLRTEWVYKPRQESGTLPAVTGEKPGEASFLRKRPEGSVGARNDEERRLLLETLKNSLDAEVYLTKNKIELSKSFDGHFTGDLNCGMESEAAATTSFPANATTTEQKEQRHQGQQSPSKRKVYGVQEVFQTAPSSPILARLTTSTTSSSSSSSTTSPSSTVLPRDNDDDDDDGFDDPDVDFGSLTVTDDFHGENQTSPRKEKQQRIDKYYAASARNNSTSKDNTEDPFRSSPLDNGKKQQPTVNDYMRVSKADSSRDHSFIPKLKLAAEKTAAEQSFSTTKTSTSDTSALFSVNDGVPTAATSFATELDDDDSQDALFRSDQFRDLLERSEQDLGQDQTDAKVNEIVKELERNGPFARRRTGRSTIPFRFRYEAQRMANASGTPLADILADDKLHLERSYDEFWRYLEELCQTRKGRKGALAKSKSGPWDAAVNHFQDIQAETEDLVTLSGRLNWHDKADGEFFEFQLNPLRFERGNRLCRRFGSDRFLEVSFPVLDINGLPSHLKAYTSEPAHLLKGIARWLATCEHHIAGRVWRGFYLEEVKQEKSRLCKAHLFAVGGDDFIKQSYPPPIPPNGQASDRRTYMTVESLLNWHMPVAENASQIDCKLFQRIRLGLSRTLPTVSVLPEDTILLKDVKPVMNDGCARMSLSLAVRIAECLGIRPTPSCFQARIAGAKGVWMVAQNDNEAMDKVGSREHWIEISESQLKIKPHPCFKKVPLDNGQLNFEVVSWSKPLRPANLNTQLLMVLQHGGVRKEHLRTLLEHEMSQFYKEYKAILTGESSALYHQWLQSRDRDESCRRKTRRVDGFPAAWVEQAIMLVDSGFLPLKQPYLMDLFEKLLNEHLNHFDELKIQISRSTYAYCIADPYGILQENEVHFAFSKSWEEHGYHAHELDDIDVLVARSPAHRPSDIQKRRAVYKKELRHFRDVIVFPTVGNTPLASLLSGGDYDGDQPWVCWDPNIVDAFRNTSYEESDSLKPEDLGLVTHSVRLDTYCRPDQTQPGSLDDFLAKMFSVNAIPSKLGLCTIQHEKLCYHENGIDSKGAMKLADLLGHLVDARKAGHEFPPENYRKIQDELGLSRLAKPAYKDEEAQAAYHNSKNIIDYLKFNVVGNKRKEIKRDFDSLKSSESSRGPDSDLTSVWTKVWDQAVAERNDGCTVLLEALGEIRKSVETALHRWVPFRNSESLPYSEKIDKAADFLEDIRPPAIFSSSSSSSSSARGQSNFGHSWFHTWQNDEESWVKFRASLAYYAQPWSSFTWNAAGPVLCEIKAKASGQPRVTIWPVYKTFKVDKKAAKTQREELLRSGESVDEISAYVDREDGYDTEVQTEFADDDDGNYEDRISLA